VRQIAFAISSFNQAAAGSLLPPPDVLVRVFGIFESPTNSEMYAAMQNIHYAPNP